MENRKQFDELFWRHRQLGQMIKALAKDIKAQRRVIWEQRKLGREMAKLLGTPSSNLIVPLPEPLKGTVDAVLRIEGTPSRQGRAAAEQWMADIGVPWDGSINALRTEIFETLYAGNSIPEGHFGLHIEWTVEIKDTTEWWKQVWAAVEEMTKTDRALSIRTIHD